MVVGDVSQHLLSDRDYLCVCLPVGSENVRGIVFMCFLECEERGVVALLVCLEIVRRRLTVEKD